MSCQKMQQDKTTGEELQVGHNSDQMKDIVSFTAHVGIGASKVAIKTCRKTNLAGTRAPPRNRVTNTKIIFVLARLRIAPLASDWPGTFQEFIEGYGGEMLEPTRPLST